MANRPPKLLWMIIVLGEVTAPVQKLLTLQWAPFLHSLLCALTQGCDLEEEVSLGVTCWIVSQDFPREGLFVVTCDP